MRDLSVVVPARNETWLKRTVEDVLAHAECDTEVIVLCDGGWPPVALDTHPNVQVLYVPTSIGQRAATNIGVKLSTAKYVMKLDAHCSMSQGFDRVLIEAAEKLGPDVTQIPAQKHLHVYDQVCPACAHRADQGPHWAGTCPACKRSVDVQKVVIWEPRKKPTTTSWRADATLHFQYDRDGEKRQPKGEAICDVMTSLGACFFMERAYYERMGGFDEAHGSWGNYGIEVAFKTWLSGGRHVVNKDCYFAHFFRVGGIGFSYPITGADQDKARAYSRDLWMNNKWPQQIYPLKWLIDKFSPLADWSEPSGAKALKQVERAAKAFRPVTVASVPIKSSKSGTSGCVYYSDVLPDPVILEACRRTIERAGLPIVAVTLKPIDWPAAQNIVLSLERSYLSMFKQILAGLEALETEFAHLVEHDLLYHHSHLSFVPPTSDRYYYNANVFKVDAESGRALHYVCNQTSGLSASRELLIEHYRKRVAAVERDGFSRRNGFEPGTRKIRHGGFDDVPYETWMSEFPNIDIRHGACLTKSRWKKEEFRDQRYTAGWTESDSVPGWGVTAGRFRELLLDDRHRELQVKLTA